MSCNENLTLYLDLLLLFFKLSLNNSLGSNYMKQFEFLYEAYKTQTHVQTYSDEIKPVSTYVAL